MTDRELLILTAAPFRAAGAPWKAAVTFASEFIAQVDQSLSGAQETPVSDCGAMPVAPGLKFINPDGSPNPELQKMHDVILAGGPLPSYPMAESSGEKAKRDAATDAAVREAKAAARRAAKVTNPLTAPPGTVISPPVVELVPTPPMPPPPTDSKISIPKNPANVPAPTPLFTEFDTDIFGCAQCQHGELRVRLPRDGGQATAICQSCGFREDFDLSADDSASIRENGKPVGGAGAAKKAPAAPLKTPAQPKIVTNKKTGEKTLVTKYVDADGEPCVSLKKLNPADEDVQGELFPEQNQAAEVSASPTTPTILTPDRQSGTPSTIESSEQRSTPSQSALPPSLPKTNAISDLVKGIVGYEAPPVNLEGARTEMRLIVAEWTPPQRLERYEKLFGQIWTGNPEDEKLVDALISASLGRISAQ